MSERLRTLLALEDLLAPGEDVFNPTDHESDDLRDRYGYEFYAIASVDGSDDKSVFLVMPDEGSCSEPVKIVNDITLNIRAVRGSGTLLLQDPDLGDEGMRAITLSEGDDPVQLYKGDSYLYMNDGTAGPLIIRDDCVPAFKSGDEIFATTPRLHSVFDQVVELVNV